MMHTGRNQLYYCNYISWCAFICYPCRTDSPPNPPQKKSVNEEECWKNCKAFKSGDNGWARYELWNPSKLLKGHTGIKLKAFICKAARAVSVKHECHKLQEERRHGGQRLLQLIWNIWQTTKLFNDCCQYETHTHIHTVLKSRTLAGVHIGVFNLSVTVTSTYIEVLYRHQDKWHPVLNHFKSGVPETADSPVCLHMSGWCGCYPPSLPELCFK